jgi:RND family efflux transporter MFP subunit
VGDLALPGAVLAVIADIGRMKIKLNVADNEIHYLQQGGITDIFSEANRAVIVRGRITEISRSANPESRSFEVKAEFSNTKDHWFRPGMFCKANIQLFKKSGIIAIPNSAILKNQSETYVFIADGKRAVKRIVGIGATDGEYTEITEGLTFGDNIVYSGMNDLKENAPLNIVRRD